MRLVEFLVRAGHFGLHAVDLDHIFTLAGNLDRGRCRIQAGGHYGGKDRGDDRRSHDADDDPFASPNDLHVSRQ